MADKFKRKSPRLPFLTIYNIFIIGLFSQKMELYESLANYEQIDNIRYL